MSTYAAIECLCENLGELDARTDPEKWNLYNGLANMAQALRAIEDQNRQILNALNQIEQRIL